AHLSHEPAADASHLSHRPATADSHTHGNHLHDAPPAMALALVVLALGSILAGYLGIPHALGSWLAPSFSARSVTTLAAGQVAEAGQEAGETVGGERGLELSLMVVSSIVALVGIALAAFIWLKRREIADRIAAAFPGVYRLLLNKY